MSGPGTKVLCLAFALVLHWAGVCSAAKGGAPKITHTYFNEPLSKLLYFKNPTTLLGIDRINGKLHRSTDSAAHWSQVKEIPDGKVTRLYAHPFEPKIAYALSGDTEHWITRDEGATWQGFTTPLPPTTSGERPFSFHADRTTWIMFIGERCVEERSGWWPLPRLVCADEAHYTRDGFAQAVTAYAKGDRTGAGVTPLLGVDSPVVQCVWARHTTEFEAMAEEAIFCTVPEPSANTSNISRRSSYAFPGPALPKLHARSLLGRSAHPGDGFSTPHASRGAALDTRSLASDVGGILDSLFAQRKTQLVVSEDFFSTRRVVHFGTGNDGTGGDRAGGGVLGVSVVKNYVLAAISHAHSEEMDLFVSMDGVTWAESHLPLPPGVEEDAYTILESTEHAIFVDVVTSASGAVSSLFRSNSNGTYYTQSLEHTHRSDSGLVDFERVQGVQGVVMANQVTNWDKASGGIFHRNALELRTRISFNDGARWRFVVPPEKDAKGTRYGCSKDAQTTGECALHLHSLTSSRTRGHIFGEPSAPGVVLAAGNVGSKLLKWSESGVFLSRDSGLSWTAVDGAAHHVQVADSGAVLAMVRDDDSGVSEVQYSLDGGSSWQRTSLGRKTLRVSALFVDDEGLSPTVVAVGTTTGGEQALVAIDFSSVWSRQCSVDPNDPVANGDMEAFVVSAHEDNDCVMGHRSEHIRRKPTAQCAMRLSQVLVPHTQDCKCSEHDFECDYNYAPTAADAHRCELVGNEVIPKGQCTRAGARFQASSGFRLIPGNSCERDGGLQLDKPVDKPCPRVVPPGGSDHDHTGGGNGETEPLGAVTHHTLSLKGDVHVMAFPNTTSYLLMTSAQELYRSSDEGLGWERIDLARSTGNSRIGKPTYVTEHTYDNSRAFVYTDSDALAYTGDRGATWTTVRTLPGKANGLHIRPLVDFSPTHADWLLFAGGTQCPGCHTEFYASQDNGAKWNRFTTHATRCRFAQTHGFATALPDAAVVCTNYKLTSGSENEQDAQKQRGNHVELLVFPDPFSGTKHYAIDIPTGENAEIVGFHVYSRFIVAAVASGAERTLQLYVSDDGRTAHAARFPPGTNIRPDGFTLLPPDADADGAILVDIEGAPNTGDSEWGGIGWGTLFASNTNGSHFHRVLRHTSRNRMGGVDVERVAGLRGVLVANRVVNAAALGRAGVRKEVQTVASWDGGRSWQPLRAPETDSAGTPVDCDDCSLNMFSQASLLGAAYGAEAAPGLLAGVGTVGAHLGRYSGSRTYASTDGGTTWNEIHGSPAQTAVGDHGALLVLVDDAAPADSLLYSTDAGATWHTHRFVDTEGVRVVVEELLGGGSEGGGQRFTIVGREVSASGAADRTAVVTVDFSALHKRQCTLDERNHAHSDFELWTPRWVAGSDHAGSGSAAPVCALGEATSYWRRKRGAACFVGSEFEPPPTRTRTCECGLADYECDEDFWLDDYGRCELDGADPLAPAGCSDGSTYMGRSGYRRIEASRCARGSEPDLAAPVQRVCGRAGGVHATTTDLDAPVADLVYFGDSRHAALRTEKGSVLVSLNEGGGGRWDALPSPGGSNAAAEKFAAIVQQPYAGDRAYFLPTTGTDALYTDDAGRTARKLRLPGAPSHQHHPALRFHPEYPDWLVFHAQPSADACPSGSVCPAEAFVSRDHGAHWNSLLPSVAAGGCSFVRTDQLKAAARNAVVCARHPASRGSEGDVVVSVDWFRSSTVLVRNATDFAVVGAFLMVSETVENGRALTLHVSADGRSAAETRFPGNKRTVDAAYTVLEADEGFEYRDSRGRSQRMPGGGVMLHVTTNARPGREWGSLYSSNSNGTYYRQSLAHVNRDETGLVDYERIRALEGVAIANVVANAAAVESNGAVKQLRSLVTVDGGARWHSLRPTGGRQPCAVTAPRSGECALHLHGYTEVSDPENIYSAAGAPGLLMGVGSVGAHLQRIGACDTYLSDDGGVSWRAVRTGPKWHEFGDHGALIVVADRIHPATEVEYSLDRGHSWTALPLPDASALGGIRIDALTTVPDSTSRRFILYGRGGRSSSRGVVVGLDFSGAQPRMCVLDANKAKTDGDFELFAPAPIDSHADDAGCLLGRRAQYYRRRGDRQCYVGNEFAPVRVLAETCECTVRDYECNHNFVPATSDSDPWGRCELVPGMRAPRTDCTDADQDYFVIESAYRRIPQSVCRGGVILDRPNEVWCPGRARTVAVLWALLLPLACLVLAFFAYRWWRSRYPYFRLHDLGAAVRPPAILRNATLLPAANAGLLKQIEPVFFGAVSTAGAVASAAREGFLWGLDRAAPYLPRQVQRWSYEHPPRWGALLRHRDAHGSGSSADASASGSAATRVRRGEGSRRFVYQPLRGDDSPSASGRASVESSALVDDYDAVESGFNHFLEEEDVDAGGAYLSSSDPGIGAGESDARPVDRQLLFANTELSDDENER
ncbi:vacuolar protein sorting/targeting protein PEP1 [Coemansia sp. Benny D160-2]|nr:vacuolar protein sorting/targeting protein PEP1 [Coemansia sp. Benny D160-2]